MIKTEETIRKTKEAINYLDSQGYGVSNVWYVEDVLTCDESLTRNEAKKVLDNALSKESVLDAINLAIVEEIEYINYPKITL